MRPPFPSRLKRVDIPELMDDANSDLRLLYATLALFRITNYLFAGYRGIGRRYVFPPTRRTDRTHHPARTVSVLDVGCGGADVAIWIAKLAARRRLKARITGIDLDPRVISFAKRKVRAAGFGPFESGTPVSIDIRYFDALSLSTLGTFDYVICTNMLHHFSDTDARRLIRSMRAVARRRFIVLDLARSRLFWLGFWILSFPLRNTCFAHFDGLDSLARAFTRRELGRLTTGDSVPVRESGSSDNPIPATADGPSAVAGSGLHPSGADRKVVPAVRVRAAFPARLIVTGRGAAW